MCWPAFWIIFTLWLALNIWSLLHGGTFGPDYTGSPLPR